MSENASRVLRQYLRVESIGVLTIIRKQPCMVATNQLDTVCSTHYSLV